jgi:hypothetical protein
MSRANIVTTRTGIHIGGHYIPKPRPMTEDAETLQAALLRKKRDRNADTITTLACLAALVALAFLA